MGRPPGNGSPAFRFSSIEVAEMEMILREHKAQVPSREVLEALAEKFSASQERSNKVQVKQVWNWFQNRRFALRAKQTNKPPEMFSAPPPLPRFNAVNNFPQTQNAARNVPHAPQPVNPPLGGGKPVSDNSSLEFEAKSARDGAWYDVASFLSHRSLETDEPDVLVRFAGFGSEEDEWVNVRKHVRPRSLPCESTECVVILPGDLILCFQEGKEQALYYDAHVIDSQRRRHDVRGCRCRFLVRYDHDQSEEIVPLRKVCRRPETDYRLLQLQSMNDSGATKQQKMNTETPHMGNTLRVYPPPSEQTMPKPQKAEESLSHGSRSISTELKNQQTKNIGISQKAGDSLSHGNRTSSTELKIQQIKNPKMGADAALNIPPVPPGFEAVTTSGAGRSDRHVATEQRSLETSNDEVVMPVTTEVPSLETKNPEVITPLAPEVKTLETKVPKVSAGGDVETSIVPPGFEAANTTIAVEVNSQQTQNPKVDAGDAGETSTVLPANDDLTSGAVTDSTLGVDAPVVPPIVKSLEIEASASDAVKIPIVPPGFEAVTSGNTPVAPVVKSLVATMSESEALKIPAVPPGFEAVTSGNPPIGMKVESPQKGNPEVIAGDVGVTLTVPSTNETVACDADPNSKTDADTSIAMEIDSLQVKDAELNAGNAEETSMVSSKEGLTSVATVDNNDNESTENMVEG